MGRLREHRLEGHHIRSSPGTLALLDVSCRSVEETEWVDLLCHLVRHAGENMVRSAASAWAGSMTSHVGTVDGLLGG